MKIFPIDDSFDRQNSFARDNTFARDNSFANGQDNVSGGNDETMIETKGHFAMSENEIKRQEEFK